jgi:AcrR family transcriptional regulator
MTMSKIKGVTSKQIARREAILEAVRTQLVNSGFDELSMRKIAVIADVSPSTLYAIYGSKESLILSATMGAPSIEVFAEEERYKPGLDRLLHRLDSIASYYMENPDTGEALAKSLFQNFGDSQSTAIFMVDTVNSRRALLEEMIEGKELAKDIDLDFYARTLVSVTWGTVLFWVKGIQPLDELRSELIKSSLAVILPFVTRKSKARVQDILNSPDFSQFRPTTID